ncbi:hypothetical protein K493DRAFT_411559 [Basidiobolus meristosporus CBS 931.73]|uniref:Uncharacterized protein n=1 Tax=Basidiobolus meristosporus CBS 931.73 TaxID=1314790 RepID=A0A1Y1XGK5_9FUNG|nr:hypothetical protein K493DRAFT_411559 [Basidiobolus meristosporus CBS 931.73]|eukprot:ORX84514.1 hypothetical protein K493DRAFT_411559 [Basidiobolus meristosporus CBS 931.73]
MFEFSVGLIGVIGVAKSKSTLLLIYLIFDALCILSSIGGIVLAFMTHDLVLQVQSVVLSLFQIYFFFAIYRYRREIKAARQTFDTVQFKSADHHAV